MKKIILSILLIILAFCVFTSYKNTLDNNYYDIKESFSNLNNNKITNNTITQNKCSSKSSCGDEKLHPILNPEYNMREVSKQCLLLEDHLNNTKKRCYDCIRKHFLTIDGFLEEAVSLEKDNIKRKYYRDLHLQWIKYEKQFAKNSKDSNNLDNVSKEIRIFRKPLVEKYFDNVSSYND